MAIFKFNLNQDDIANQVVAGIIVAACLAIVVFGFKHLKKLWSFAGLKLFTHLPKIINRALRVISTLVHILVSPLARFLYLFLVSLIFPWIFQSPYGFLLAIFVALVSWSFYSEVTRSKSIKDPIFSDSFENLDSWETISGKPKAEKGFGQPAPSMLLPIVENDTGKHTVVELKELIFTNGIIELDVYLEQGSLIDVIFRGDIKAGKYYMARFDSRAGSGNHDAFLRNDGNGFNFIGSSSRNTSPDSWHKMRIVITGDNFQLYDENGFVFSATDDKYKKGAVGVFNEVANVYVDNFLVKT